MGPPRRVEANFNEMGTAVLPDLVAWRAGLRGAAADHARGRGDDRPTSDLRGWSLVAGLSLSAIGRSCAIGLILLVIGWSWDCD